MIIDPLILNGFLLAFSVFWLHSAWVKLSDTRRFSGIIIAYKLIPDFFALAVTIGLGLFEISIAVMLWSAIGKIYAVSIGVSVLALYAVAIAINLGRGRFNLDCGCHGFNTKEPIRAWMIVRHGILVMGMLLIVSAAPSRQENGLDVVLSMSGALVVCLLYSAIDQLLRNRTAQVMG